MRQIQHFTTDLTESSNPSFVSDDTLASTRLAIDINDNVQNVLTTIGLGQDNNPKRDMAIGIEMTRQLVRDH